MDVVGYETAANMWPEKAKHIGLLHGKDRSRARRKLRDEATFETLLRCGALCKNCPSFRGAWCNFHTDARGKQTAHSNGLCLQYHGKHQPKEVE